MILRVHSAEHPKFSINFKKVPGVLPKALTGDAAILQGSDLLHFSNDLIKKTRGLSETALERIVEAISPNSSSKQLESILNYGYPVFVTVSHLKRTILLSNELGKTAVERDSDESLNLYSAFKRYFASAKAKAAA